MWVGGIDGGSMDFAYCISDHEGRTAGITSLNWSLDMLMLLLDGDWRLLAAGIRDVWLGEVFDLY